MPWNISTPMWWWQISRSPISTKTNIAWVLKKTFPKIKVIILSVYDEKSVLDDVMAAGVEGFVLKHRAVIDLIPAIRGVMQGCKYFRQM